MGPEIHGTHRKNQRPEDVSRNQMNGWKTMGRPNARRVSTSPKYEHRGIEKVHPELGCNQHHTMEVHDNDENRNEIN
jgi:hypothetical protein